jgi:hypothetical protein
MYKKVVYKAFFKGILQFLIMPLCIVYFIHKYFNSFTITYFTCLILLVLLAYLWLRPNIKHKQSLEKLKLISNQIDGYIERALDEDLKNEWEKGLGLIGDIQQLMWVNVTRDGIEVLIISKENQGSCIIPWHSIQILTHQHYYDGDNPIALIEIGLADDPIQIFTPWRSSFNNLVPDTVGIS